MKVRRSYLDEAVDRVNLHIYPSPFTHESRILKETKSMADAGLVSQVFLVGIWDEGLPETEQLDPKRQICRIKPSIGSQQSSLLIKTLRYLEWQWKIYSRFKKSPVKYINCHSLPVLPIGVFFKIFKRATLIYDTHELETESIGSVGFKRLLYKLV